VRDTQPDVVLLDLMLPGMNGIDVCRAIRAESGVPIVMLTAKSDTVDVVLGPGVRRRRLRREAVQAQGARRADPGPGAAQRRRARRAAVDRRRSTSTCPRTRSPARAEQIALTPLEFDLLVALARKPRQVFTREVLLEQVWGYRHAADTRLVNVHVQRLRSKVERDPERPEVVLTVRGVGYKAGPP
jgi:two-component system response regulator MtrA